MARFLFVTFGTHGHLHPFLEPARRLAAQAHEVVFCSNVALDERLAASGLSASSFVIAPRTVRDSAAADRVGQTSDSFANGARRLLWYRLSLLSGLAAEVEALRALVRQLRPDVLCVNPMFYAGAIVAESEALPWACLSPTLLPVAPRGWDTPFIDTLERIGAELLTKPSATRVSLRVERGCVVSPWLNMVFTVEQFAPRAQAGNSNVHYLGVPSPSIQRGDERAFDWSDLPDSGLVYVTGGTQAGFTLEQFAEIARAFAGAPRQVVLSVYQATPATFVADLPANVRAFPYVPQDEMIRRSALVICHGGANTIADCLRQGVPSLVIPRAHDQFLQARLVADAGVGATLAAEALSSARCRALADELLAAGSPASQRAAAFRGWLSGEESAEHAARLLAELAQSRRPLSPTP